MAMGGDLDVGAEQATEGGVFTFSSGSGLWHSIPTHTWTQQDELGHWLCHALLQKLSREPSPLHSFQAH